MGIIKMESKEVAKDWFIEEKKYENYKFLYLGLAFFCVIAAYTFTRELKDSIFAYMVGREYIPYAKWMSMLILVPAILLYSQLVDTWRRYYLICFYSSFYAIMSIVFAYYLGHPTIGIANATPSPNRLLGWLFYFFIEGFSPFVVSVFWAFANSITNPESAKNRYGYMVSYSKAGGMFSAALGWALLCWKSADGQPVFTDIVGHQLILYISAFFLSVIPFIVYLLIKKVPGRFLHGYEAVYQVEKKKSKESKPRVGIFDGLKMLFKYPYVMGIFGMVFFYEVITTVMSYLRLVVVQSHSTGISGVSGELFKIIFLTHFVGFLVSYLGTTRLLKSLGEKRCLILIPSVSGALIFLFLATGYNVYALIVAYVGLKAINYGFSWPVRESLYIPTVKEIKFKSKSWIDAFGSKFAKSTGGMAIASGIFDLGGVGLIGSVFHPMNFFFLAIVCFWGMTAYFLGNQYEKAVNENKVIGLED